MIFLPGLNLREIIVDFREYVPRIWVADDRMRLFGLNCPCPERQDQRLLNRTEIDFDVTTCRAELLCSIPGCSGGVMLLGDPTSFRHAIRFA
jgi:hypothetical protein